MINKKRGTILLIISLIILSMSLASAQKTIKEDWFEHYETFIIGSDIYEVKLSQDYKNVLFRQNEYRNLISLGSCRDHESYTFCYQNYSFEKKPNIDDKGQLMPGIHIKITQADAASGHSATIKSSETGSKFTNYEQEAKITIKNTATIHLSGAQLEITIPEGINITNRKNFVYLGNKLTIPVSLSPNEEKEYVFNYEIKTEGNKRVDYDLTKEGVSIRKGSFTVKGLLPYEIKITNPKDMYIRELKTFEILVKNIHMSNDLEIKELILTGPVNFQYVPMQRLTRTGFAVHSATNVVIPARTERVFSVRYRPFFAGSYTFNLVTQLSHNYEYEENFEEKIEVLNDGLATSLQFTRKEISLNSESDLQIILKNEHASLSFRNIEAKIESALYNGTETLSNIAPGSIITLLNQKIIPPQLEEDKTYEVKATITFSNEAGQKETVILTDSLKVIGKGPLLKISHKLTPRSTTKAEEEIIIETTIQNLADNQLRNVEIKDTFSQKVTMIAGQTSKTTNMLGKQNEQAYLYKIKMPERPTRNELIITTTARIPDLDYEVQQTSRLKVDGQIYEDEHEEEEQEILEEEQEIIEEEKEKIEREIKDQEKETNFLRRMIRGIERFFSNLF